MVGLLHQVSTCNWSIGCSLVGLLHGTSHLARNSLGICSNLSNSLASLTDVITVTSSAVKTLSWDIYMVGLLHQVSPCNWSIWCSLGMFPTHARACFCGINLVGVFWSSQVPHYDTWLVVHSDRSLLCACVDAFVGSFAGSFRGHPKCPIMTLFWSYQVQYYDTGNPFYHADQSLYCEHRGWEK